MYSGSFNVYSAQGIQLDYSGDHDDKCQGELVYNTCEAFYYRYCVCVCVCVSVSGCGRVRAYVCVRAY